MKRIAGVTALLTAALAVVAISYHSGEASDHDDGEQPDKSRELNLTDHFAFKSPASPDELAMISYFNPRSLPQRQYFLNVGARYEQHVTKVANKTDSATGKDDYVFRFEATTAPDGNGVQQVKLTVLKPDAGGALTEAGSMMGATTSFAGSSNNSNLTINQGNIGGLDVKWFIGQRADSFHFDVARFFEVRSFLARRFFGGPGGTTGDATAGLAPNCRGDQFLSILGANPQAGEAGGVGDADLINLWNPPSCAPDFTKGLNVTAIVLNTKINQLGGTVFDTWSTISVPK
jgi:hypothetical protein